MNEALWKWKWATVSKTVDVLVYGCNRVVVSFDGKCLPRAARILKEWKEESSRFSFYYLNVRMIDDESAWIEGIRVWISNYGHSVSHPFTIVVQSKSYID